VAACRRIDFFIRIVKWAIEITPDSQNIVPDLPMECWSVWSMAESR
jgi:hypothetical protein